MRKIHSLALIVLLILTFPAALITQATWDHNN